MVESSIRGEARSRGREQRFGREKRGKDETELVERSFMRGAGRVNRRLLPAQDPFLFFSSRRQSPQQKHLITCRFCRISCIGS